MIAVVRTTSGMPLVRSSSMYIISRSVDEIGHIVPNSVQGGVFGETPSISVQYRKQRRSGTRIVCLAQDA